MAGKEAAGHGGPPRSGWAPRGGEGRGEASRTLNGGGGSRGCAPCPPTAGEV